MPKANKIVALAVLIGLVAQGCNKSRDDAHSRELADRVRAEFLHAWNNYERYAWGHDALKPLSRSGHDWYGQSLLMTPVDALDTLILMKLDDEATKAREIIVKDPDWCWIESRFQRFFIIRSEARRGELA